MNKGQYIEKYRLARKGKGDLVVLEGIHAIKHALRFGADILEILYVNKNEIFSLKENVLTKNEKNIILEKGIEVNDIFFDSLIPYKIRTKILALAKKPLYDFEKNETNKVMVFLENPANPENIGMAIRAAAAFGGGGLIVNGIISPFSASVIRAAAGLIYAIPIFYIDKLEDLKKFKRIIIAADPEGLNLKEIEIPANSIIAFGTERDGLSKEIKEMSKIKISLKMKEGVSSLNLATSVSAILFSAKFKL